MYRLGTDDFQSVAAGLVIETQKSQRYKFNTHNNEVL